MSDPIDVADLWGMWRLTSYEATAVESSETIYPLGEDAIGCLCYTPSGRMAAQLMRRHRRRSTVPRWEDITAEDAQAAARGYIAYSGTYAVVGAQVVHHVETSLFPNWVGTDLSRAARFDGDLLELCVSAPVHLHGALRAPLLRWTRS